MKILHFGKFYPPFYGGIEKVNLDIVDNLNKRNDCELDVLCFSHSKDYQETLSTDYKLFRIPIKRIIASTPIPKGMFSLFKRIRNNYDIIHLHLPNPIASLAVLRYPSKAKLVVHWHGDIMKYGVLLSLYKPFQTMILKRADRVIVTSDNFAKHSKTLQNYLDKVMVIPIGIDNSYLQANAEKINSIKAEFRGKRIVLSIGRLTYYKGFQYLIEAAKYLDNNTIVLIGGVGELETALRKQISDLCLENKVRLLGRIPGDYMGSYLKVADVYCLSSVNKAEAFGIVLIEAMSLGTPIVASDIYDAGASWINQNGVTGYNVEIGNPKEIAMGINKILNNASIRASFSHNCIERYKEIFTLEKMLDKTYELYRELM